MDQQKARNANESLALSGTGAQYLGFAKKSTISLEGFPP
jgi:hypothetical protein